jgi:hypothetical protein
MLPYVLPPGPPDPDWRGVLARSLVIVAVVALLGGLILGVSALTG